MVIASGARRALLRREARFLACCTAGACYVALAQPRPVFLLAACLFWVVVRLGASPSLRAAVRDALPPLAWPMLLMGGGVLALAVTAAYRHYGGKALLSYLVLSRLWLVWCWLAGGVAVVLLSALLARAWQLLWRGRGRSSGIRFPQYRWGVRCLDEIVPLAWFLLIVSGLRSQDGFLAHASPAWWAIPGLFAGLLARGEADGQVRWMRLLLVGAALVMGYTLVWHAIVHAHDQWLIANLLVHSRLPLLLTLVLLGMLLLGAVCVLALSRDWPWRCANPNRLALRFIAAYLAVDPSGRLYTRLRHLGHRLTHPRSPLRWLWWVLRVALDSLLIGCHPRLLPRAPLQARYVTFLRAETDLRQQCVAAHAEGWHAASLHQPDDAPSRADRTAPEARHQAAHLRAWADYLLCPFCRDQSGPDREAIWELVVRAEALLCTVPLSLDIPEARSLRELLPRFYEVLEEAYARPENAAEQCCAELVAFRLEMLSGRGLTDGRRLAYRKAVVRWVACWETDYPDQRGIAVGTLLHEFAGAEDWAGMVETGRLVALARPGAIGRQARLALGEAYWRHASELGAGPLFTWAQDQAVGLFYAGASPVHLEAITSPVHGGRPVALARQIGERSTPSGDPGPELVEEFRRLPAERSIWWAAVTAVWTVCVWLLALLTAYCPLLPSPLNYLQRPYGGEASVKVGDCRLGADYRRFTLDDWAFVGDDDLVIATRGGGAARCRLDGGQAGFWETLLAKDASDPHPTADLRQVLSDERRVWFVGRNGSLTSCDRHFGDWKAHFGGGGFQPGLDLTRDINNLVVSSDRSFYAVGSEARGLGVYDTLTRQWYHFGPEWGSLNSSHVTALAQQDRWLYVGTDRGLVVFEVSRAHGPLRFARRGQCELPAPFTHQPVASINLVTAPRNTRVQCVVGTGAVLETGLAHGGWQVVVPEADPRLADLDGPAEASGFAPVRGGAWLAIPSQGFAYYDAGAHRLSASNTGLPKRVSAVAVQNLGASEQSPDLWGVGRSPMVGKGRLYRWSGRRWDGVSDADENVVALQAVAGTPLVGLDTGELVQFSGLAAASRQTFRFFESTTLRPPFGPVEVGAGQLFVAAAPGRSARAAAVRYLPDRRSWQDMPADTSAPLRQLRASEATLWVVKRNGEAGRYDVSDTSGRAPYTPVFGTTQLATGPGEVTTAESSGGAFWFVRRQARGAAHVYVYSPHRRTITARNDGLTNGFLPLQLRATHRDLYLWGRQEGTGSVYSLSSSSWTPVPGEESNVDQVVAASPGLLSRRASGEVSLHSRPSVATTFFAGRGHATWRRLAPDRFGRLWGVPTEGAASVYTAASGTWTEPPMPGRTAFDVVVARVDDDKDNVLVATDEGVREWQSTRTKLAPAKKAQLAKEAVRQLDFDGERVWALTDAQDGTRRALWRRAASGGKWRMVWQTTLGSQAPGREDWAQAAWAGFAGKELWWVTPGGTCWRYRLDRQVWQAWTLSTQGAIEQMQAPRPGVLWYSDGSDNLYLARLGKSENALFDGCPEYHSRWETVELILRCAAWAAGGIAAVLLLLPPIVGVLLLLLDLLLRMVGLEGAEGYYAPPWPWLTGFALAAAVLAASSFVVQLAFIGPYQPFIGKHFLGQVLDFSVDRHSLWVRTNAGLWQFGYRGGAFSPTRFLAHPSSLPQAAKPTYPATDDSGRFRITGGPGVFSLWRKAREGGFQACHFGDAGLEEDAIAAVGGNGRGALFVSTPRGVAQYADGKQLELVRFSSVPPGHLLRQDDVMFYLTPQQTYQCTAGATELLSPTDAWRARQEACGRRWEWRAGESRLLSGEYDAQARRFYDDKCLRLARDPSGTGWIETEAGWRHVQVSARGVSLSPPRRGRGPTQVRSTRLTATDTWVCERDQTDPSRDAITFLFSPTPERAGLNDPFASRGRWPDEDVRAVLPRGDAVYFGTAYGLRRQPSRADRKVELADREVQELAAYRGAIYARTPAGDYALSRGGWQRCDASVDVFAALRTVRLPLGQGLSVAATERAAPDGPVSTCEAFAPRLGRFRLDLVGSFSGDAQGFWILTPAGLQRLNPREGRLVYQRADLPGHAVTALRYDRAGAYYAQEAGGGVWRYDNRTGWHRPPQDSLTPFSTPIAGALSDIIRWERHFRRGGDAYLFQAQSYPLAFIAGKFSSDYVEAAAGEAHSRWVATPAGVVSYRATDARAPRALLAWPEGGRGPIASQEGHLLCRSHQGPLRYDPIAGAWQPTQTTAFDPQEAWFDGASWHDRLMRAERPRIVLRLPGGTENPAVLNRLGQFPFDSVQSVASRAGELWISHGTGVAVYTPGGREGASYRQGRYLHAQWCPEWLGQRRTTRLTSDREGRIWMAFLDSSNQPFDYRVMGSSSTSFRPLRVSERGPEHFTPTLDWQGGAEGDSVQVLADEATRELRVRRRGQPVSVTAIARPLELAQHGQHVYLLTEDCVWHIDPSQ